LSIEIRTRDAASRARTGTLKLEHGEVRTPAFVPLATKAVIKTLEVREAAELGFDMVLGNTFHLFLTPGHELIRRFGGVHRFMGWDRPVITDSGGFQIFSMGHGTVADEIKGRSAQSSGGDRAGAILKIAEEGVTFRSYLDGSTEFMGPETSMEVQAALGSDIALVLDECTPFHGGRDYTARSTERTHRWLDRCLAWHEQHGPEGQIVYGIVQGGVEEDLRRASAQEVAARPVGGIAIGGTLGEHKAQMYEVVDWAIDELDEGRPRHLLGIGEIDDLVRGIELGVDTFDCAMPTRIGRHGMALVPDPDRRWRVDLAKARVREVDEPLLDGCPCPACAHGYTRAYLHYLFKAQEQTAQRLVTIHNLAFVQRLMAELRAAIDEGRLAEAAAAVRGGAAPWELGNPQPAEAETAVPTDVAG
jgi:queuine tRNA-ribosyltransferase